MDQVGTHKKGNNLVSTFETGSCQPQALPNQDKCTAAEKAGTGLHRGQFAQPSAAGPRATQLQMPPRYSRR